MQTDFNEFSQACQTLLREHAQQRRLDGGQKKPVQGAPEAPVKST
jgi:hypothetical protein